MAATSQCHSRVLILGPTGIDKKEVCRRVAEYADTHFRHSVQYYDFEKEFISPLVPDFQTFLNDRIVVTHQTWEKAWEIFKRELDGDIILLCLHATFVSGLFGARSAISINSIVFVRNLDPPDYITCG